MTRGSRGAGRSSSPKPVERGRWPPPGVPALLRRLHGVAFPKKVLSPRASPGQRRVLRNARGLVEEVYSGSYPSYLPPPGPRACRAGSYLHLTHHSLPHDEVRRLRLAAVAALVVGWLLLYPLATKLRAVSCALVYSCMEWTFTLVERGTPYTSVGQLGANLLYTPVLLDVYCWLLQLLLAAAHTPEHWLPTLYIVLFPLNVWVLELVVERLILIPLYGRNVAWCYADYADEAFGGCIRIGHAPAWWLLGMIAWAVYPLVTDISVSVADHILRQLSVMKVY